MNQGLSDKYKKILVRCTNWLGDAVMTTPFFSFLRKAFPASRIEIKALPYIAPVFENNPNIDAITILKRQGGVSGFLGSLGALVSRRGDLYDLGISLPNSFGAAVDLKKAGCREILGYNRDMRGILLDHPVPFNKEMYNVHEIFYYLNILRSFLRNDGKDIVGDACDKATKGAEPRYEIYLSRAEREAAMKKLNEIGIDISGNLIVGLNPGAFFGSAKRWPVERYAKVVARLSAEYKNVRFVVFGSAKEEAFGREICASAPDSAFNFCGKTSIRELISHISMCRLFLTNDSGAMHIAAAFDIGVVAIFGSTDHASTYPVCSDGLIIRRDIDCAPCKKRECPLGHHKCMNLISVDEVYKVMKNKIERIIKCQK